MNKGVAEEVASGANEGATELRRKKETIGTWVPHLWWRHSLGDVVERTSKEAERE